jgi:hypothetical protein
LSRLPLVLAIEPDLRQAAIVKRVVKERVQAEIVVVDSRDAAIAAIKTAIPDVLLVSALLSPRDEDDLMAHLRTLEGATHLQTHTIPQLASTLGGDSGGRGGLLSAFRRKKVESTPAGCDPDLFADEVRMYVKRSEERKHEAALAGPVALPTRVNRPSETPVAAPPEEPAPVAGSSWASPFEWRPSNSSSYVATPAPPDPSPAPPIESFAPPIGEPSIENLEPAIALGESGDLGPGIGDLGSGNGDRGSGSGYLEAESGDLGSGNGDLGSGSAYPEAESGDLGSGNGDLGSGSAYPEAESGPESGSAYLVAESGDLESGNGNLASGIEDLGPSIRDLGPRIGDLESEIGRYDHESSIGDSLPPMLAGWARQRPSITDLEYASPTGEFHDLIAGLGVPNEVASVAYAQGCRIRRVRVPVAREQHGPLHGAVLLSRRMLAELRGTDTGA